MKIRCIKCGKEMGGDLEHETRCLPTLDLCGSCGREFMKKLKEEGL